MNCPDFLVYRTKAHELLPTQRFETLGDMAQIGSQLRSRIRKVPPFLQFLLVIWFFFRIFPLDQGNN